MKTDLSTGYIIEGFDNHVTPITALNRSEVYDVAYAGKTSDIPEEIAEKCVIQYGIEKGSILDDGLILGEDCMFGFKNYKKGYGVLEFDTAKESIQSACCQPFCIIYKEKKQ